MICSFVMFIYAETFLVFSLIHEGYPFPIYQQREHTPIVLLLL
jgi:hypothetical protein